MGSPGFCDAKKKSEGLGGLPFCFSWLKSASRCGGLLTPKASIAGENLDLQQAVVLGVGPATSPLSPVTHPPCQIGQRGFCVAKWISTVCLWGQLLSRILLRDNLVQLLGLACGSRAGCGGNGAHLGRGEGLESQMPRLQLESGQRRGGLFLISAGEGKI